MPVYAVRLDSTVDDQYRIRRLEAPDEKQAAKQAGLLEATRVRFDVTARGPIKRLDTRRDREGVHATVNLDMFADTGMGGHDQLAHLERDHAVEAGGKAYGPNVMAREYLQAHYQTEPYKVTAVDLYVPNAQQVVQAILALQEHEGAWEKVLNQLRDHGVPLNAVTAALFGLQMQKQVDGSAPIIWSSATIKQALTTSAWTPDQDTHDFFNDVTNEVVGTGYTAGGVTLASKTSTYDTATNGARLDAADASWASSTITARRAPLYNDTAGASSTDPVIGWIDFGADVSTSNGTLQIAYDPTGIEVYTAA